MPDRRAQLTAEVTARLRRVCGHLPPDDFTALVTSVVDTTLKYEQRRDDFARDWGERASRPP